MRSSIAQQLFKLHPQIVFFTTMANRLDLLDNALKATYEQHMDWSLFPPNLRQVSYLVLLTNFPDGSPYVEAKSKSVFVYFRLLLFMLNLTYHLFVVQTIDHL